MCVVMSRTESYTSERGGKKLKRETVCPFGSPALIDPRGCNYLEQ